MTAFRFGFIFTAVLLELLLVLLRAAAQGPEPVHETVILTLIAAHIVYLPAVYLVCRMPSGSKGGLVAVLLVSAVFRLTMWPLESPATEDLFRYRWEAQVQAHGGNPYTSRPIDPGWSHLRDAAWPKVGQKEVPAGYGPAWEMLGALVYRTAAALTDDPFAQAFAFKVPAALFDVGVVGLLILLLRRRGLPGERVLIYSWSPLPLWEFWANGHNDAPVIFFLVLVLLAVEKRRWSLAGGAAGMAIALKLWPVLLLPAFTLQTRRWRIPAIAAGVVLLWCLPYRAEVSWNIRYMSGFVGGWRNNDSLYGILLSATGDQYRAKYLSFFLICSLALWFATRRSWSLERILLWTVVSLLLFSSNCHPWYLTWMAPLLVFEPALPVLLWVALMPLTYSVLTGWTVLREWNGTSEFRWFVYIPVFLSLLWCIYRENVPVAVRGSGPDAIG